MTTESPKGQAVIEVLFVSLAMTMFFALIASAFYLYYAKTMSSHYSHRALLCIEELEARLSECEWVLNEKLDKTLFFKDRLSAKLTKNSYENTSTVNFSYFGLYFNWQKKIRVRVR